MKRKVIITVSSVVTVAILFSAAFILRYAYINYVTSSYPLKYQSEVEAASEKYGVDIALIYAVIKSESNFDEDAVSSAGAIGLMQLMPDTFEWVQTYYTDGDDGYTVDDLTDYAVNIDYGTHLLAILLDMYEEESSAICAYNAGVARVDSWLEDSEYSDDGVTLKYIPIEETRNYLEKVTTNKNVYLNLYFSD